MIDAVYIGDGVYASHDDDGIMLWTDRLDEITDVPVRHWLVLGPSEWHNLRKFVRSLNDEE